VALASAAEQAAAVAPTELAEHAREETGHVDRWRDFRRALAEAGDRSRSRRRPRARTLGPDGRIEA
jgi:hypothetical protein